MNSFYHARGIESKTGRFNPLGQVWKGNEFIFVGDPKRAFSKFLISI